MALLSWIISTQWNIKSAMAFAFLNAISLNLSFESRSLLSSAPHFHYSSNTNEMLVPMTLAAGCRRGRGIKREIRTVIVIFIADIAICIWLLKTWWPIVVAIIAVHYFVVVADYSFFGLGEACRGVHPVIFDFWYAAQHTIWQVIIPSFMCKMACVVSLSVTFAQVPDDLYAYYLFLSHFRWVRGSNKSKNNTELLTVYLYLVQLGAHWSQAPATTLLWTDSRGSHGRKPVKHCAVEVRGCLIDSWNRMLTCSNSRISKISTFLWWPWDSSPIPNVKSSDLWQACDALGEGLGICIVEERERTGAQTVKPPVEA